MKHVLYFLTIMAVCLSLPPVSTVHADDKFQITDMAGRQVVHPAHHSADDPFWALSHAHVGVGGDRIDCCNYH